MQVSNPGSSYVKLVVLVGLVVLAILLVRWLASRVMRRFDDDVCSDCDEAIDDCACDCCDCPEPVEPPGVGPGRCEVCGYRLSACYCTEPPEVGDRLRKARHRMLDCVSRPRKKTLAGCSECGGPHSTYDCNLRGV